MGRIGRFELEEELGRGGMGVVYRGRQPSLDRPVVLKRMRRDALAEPALVERFEREARAAAAVHHGNVVAIYDHFVHRGDHYIAAEYLPAGDLKALLAHAGPLPARLAALVALEVARGLEEIHALGIVHRDLKPANVLLGPRGEVKIADFGIAQAGAGAGLTRTGMVLGSLPYAAPEQLRGGRAEPRSDLWALGVLLYEALAGAPPFALPAEESPGEAAQAESGADPAADTLLDRMERGRLPPLRRRRRDVPRALVRIIAGCLRPRARQRFASAAALRRRLERQLGGPSTADARAEVAGFLRARGLAAGAGGTRPRTAPPARRRPAARPRALRLALAAAALAAALLLAESHAPGPPQDAGASATGPTARASPPARR